MIAIYVFDDALELLADHPPEQSKQVQFKDESQNLTYADLETRTGRFAERLHALDLDRLLIHPNKATEATQSNLTMTNYELAFIADDFGTRIIVADTPTGLRSLHRSRDKCDDCGLHLSVTRETITRHSVCFVRSEVVDGPFDNAVVSRTMPRYHGWPGSVDEQRLASNSDRDRCNPNKFATIVDQVREGRPRFGENFASTESRTFSLLLVHRFHQFCLRTGRQPGDCYVIQMNSRSVHPSDN